MGVSKNRVDKFYCGLAPEPQIFIFMISLWFFYDLIYDFFMMFFDTGPMIWYKYALFRCCLAWKNNSKTSTVHPKICMLIADLVVVWHGRTHILHL